MKHKNIQRVFGKLDRGEELTDDEVRGAKFEMLLLQFGMKIARGEEFTDEEKDLYREIDRDVRRYNEEHGLPEPPPLPWLEVH